MTFKSLQKKKNSKDVQNGNNPFFSALDFQMCAKREHS